MNRAFHVRAIDGKDLESLIVDVSYPARQILRLSIGWRAVGVAILAQPGFSSRKVLKISHRHPMVIAQIPFEHRT